MRNVSDKFVERIKTRFMLSKIIFRESRLLWDNVENVAEPDRPQLTIQYRAEKMRFACRKNKGKIIDTHSEY